MKQMQVDSNGEASAAHARRRILCRHMPFMAIVVALGGCGAEDEIRSYRVPRTPAPAAPAPKARLLAALIPQGDTTWAIKLMGPIAAVAEHAGAFHKFVESVHLAPQADPPLTWTVPAGWRTAKEVAFSRATFQLGSEDHPLQVTVTPVAGGGANAVLVNVNRWRGQLGLAPLPAAELSKVSKSVTVNGVPAALVDMSGPGVPSTGRRS